VWRRVDDVLRFLYVLLAPAVIVVLSKVVPIVGILISTGVATVIALSGSTRWIKFVSTIRFVGRPLAKFGRLGEYYRVHAPKPLIYYVLYPLLAPYWLINRTARREFFAYRRVGALALIVTVVSALYDYVHNWSPIPKNLFFGMMVGVTILQLLITCIVVMPIVTTLIGYQKRGHKKSIAVLLAASLALGGAMWWTLHRFESVPMAVQMRLRARIKWQPEPAHAAIRAALEAALTHAGDADKMAPVEAARDTLETVFRPDEARAFMLYHGGGVVILVARTRNHEYAWAAQNKAGPITSAADLPPALRDAMDLAPTASVWP
jgi:hypothetical protein